MKKYVKANTASDDGYLYFTKHGLGPGTLPKDVHIIDTQDLDNYITAIWLDRFLTTDELKQYDIYPENSWQHEKYKKQLDELQDAYYDHVQSFYASKSIKCSTVKNGNTFRLQNEIWDAIVKFMTSPYGGFEPDEVKDYAFVDVTTDDEEPNYYVVEVRAELSYRGMEKLLEYIDPIVQKYDKDAYFDFVDPGIVEAYVHK